MYKKEYVQTFLEKQGQLFDEPVAEDAETAATLKHLDERIFESPAFAVETAALEVVHMGQITYENVSGATNGNPASYTYGTSVTLQAPAKSGHSFDGWYDNAECTGDAVSEISATETGNKTFYAKWTPIPYTVSWDANGGTLTGSYTSGTVDYGTAIIEPTPTREGYTFIGWEPEVPATVPDQNSTFTAQWKLNQHTLTWNANGGTLTGSYTSGTVDYGTAITAPTATRTGYTFDGIRAYLIPCPTAISLSQPSGRPTPTP